MPVIVPFPETDDIVGTLVPENRATKGFGPGLASPLATFVSLGAPMVTRLTAATTGLDPLVAHQIDSAAGNRFYHVGFSCTFHPSGNESFEKAWVLGTFTPNEDDTAPIALSLDPLRSDTPVEISNSLELGVDFKILSAKAGGDTKIPSSLIFIEALNEGHPDPSWEFTQTQAQRLSGSQRLRLVVQTGKHGGHGAIELQAQVARRESLLQTFRADFGQKPRIEFELM